MLCTAAAVVCYQLAVFFIGLFLELTTLGRLPGFLITAGLSLLAVPALYPVTLAIGKIGGEVWKE
jgi:hypothetical protein